MPVPKAPLPLSPSITLEDRGEHTAIIGGAGHGKTQLMLNTIADDLQHPDPPGMVIIDPTGAMTRQVQRLALFNERLKDRLIIIDPEHDPAPALNMFDLPMERFANYSSRQRQALENEIVDLFSYIFASADTPLTGLQSGPFALGPIYLCFGGVTEAVQHEPSRLLRDRDVLSHRNAQLYRVRDQYLIICSDAEIEIIDGICIGGPPERTY